MRKMIFSYIIKDIYSYKDDYLITKDSSDNLHILKYNDNNKYSDKASISNVSLAINDLSNKKNLFLLRNYSKCIEIIYYHENIKESTDNNKFAFIYMEQKNIFLIKNLFDDINDKIESSDIKKEHKKMLKSFFILPELDEIKQYDLLFSIDQSILKFIDYEFTELYNKINDIIEIDDDKDKDKNDIIFNTNYLIHKLRAFIQNKNENKNKEIINYILNLYNFVCDIREKYFDYIANNSELYNGYNYNNNYLIFTEEKYIIMEFDIRKKHFYSPITPNFILMPEKNGKDFDIVLIYPNFIILNNIKNKIFYILERVYDIYLIKNKYEYYSNIFSINKNLLLFDIINNNSIEFSILDMSNFQFIENNYLKGIFNIQISSNIPKIISFNNSNKFILLYNNNQICIIDYLFLN